MFDVSCEVPCVPHSVPGSCAVGGVGPVDPAALMQSVPRVCYFRHIRRLARACQRGSPDHQRSKRLWIRFSFCFLLQIQMIKVKPPERSHVESLRGERTDRVCDQKVQQERLNAAFVKKAACDGEMQRTPSVM